MLARASDAALVLMEQRHPLCNFVCGVSEDLCVKRAVGLAVDIVRSAAGCGARSAVDIVRRRK